MKLLLFAFLLQTTLTGCRQRPAETDKEIQKENRPDVLDVMDYCGRWEELVSVSGMELMDKTLGLGNVYEGNGFDLDFRSDETIELRNGECRNLSVSGVLLGDDKDHARETLEKETWLYCNLYLDINCDLYITKRDGRYDYLQVYYSADNNLVEHWYLYNWSNDGPETEACAVYDAFIKAKDAWKKAYIKLIAEKGINFDSWSNSYRETYKLVDIDGGNIPELYINSGSTAGGDWVCSYYDGMTITKNIWNYGFTYIEGQNRFMDYGGKMDMYHNLIYCIEDGSFTLLGNGSFGTEDPTHLQYDADGHVIYQYYWNEAPVSSEQEYQRLLQAVYDEQKADNPYEGAQFDDEKGRYVGNGLCDIREILKAIVDY